MAFAGVLGRVWIPLVVAMVAGAGTFTVSRVRADFGSEPPLYPYTETADTDQLNPKAVVYEVFGPVGTVADISYLDVNADPQRVNGARLPWSMTLTARAPTVVGNVVAQGDSDSIGCRIVIDGRSRPRGSRTT